MKSLFAATVAVLAISAPAHASLVASYSFDNASNLGLDSSGNGNNLVGIGNVASGAGYTGGALSLSGSGYLSSANSLAPNGTPLGSSAYTVAAWIKTTAQDGGGIIGWGQYGTYNDVTALRLSGGGSGLVNYWWNNDTFATDYSIADGAWHYVVDTSNGTSQQIYIDNVLLGSRDAGTGHGTTAANFGIGVTCLTVCGNYTQAGLGEFFTGSIDNMQIYNNVFTAQDVANGFTNVPEPGMLGLFGLGAIGLGLSRRRKIA